MSTPWPSPSSRSLLGVFDEGAGWAGTGTAGRAQGHHRRGEVRGGGEPGRARAAGASLRGARVGKVVWGDAAQKSTQGCREAACGLGGGGGQGASRGAGSPPPRAAVQAPGSGHPTLQSLLPPGLRFPPPAVAEFRSSPGPPLPGAGARRP